MFPDPIGATLSLLDVAGFLFARQQLTLIDKLCVAVLPRALSYLFIKPRCYVPITTSDVFFSNFYLVWFANNDTFCKDTVQSRLKSNKKLWPPRKNPWLLQGLITCGQCGLSNQGQQRSLAKKVMPVEGDWKKVMLMVRPGAMHQHWIWIGWRMKCGQRL